MDAPAVIPEHGETGVKILSGRVELFPASKVHGIYKKFVLLRLEGHTYLLLLGYPAQMRLL